MNNGVDMLLHKKITALCCIVFLLAGVGGYTADAAINTEVGSLSGMPLPAPKKSETGKKITLNLASRLLTLYEGTEKVFHFRKRSESRVDRSENENYCAFRSVKSSWVPLAGPLRELRYSWDERAMVYRPQCISRLYPYV